MKLLSTMIMVIVSTAAQAGTVLKFQTGSVDPTQSTQLFSQAQGARDYVVQFHSAITEADKKMLQAQGAQIFRYVPDDALIVRAEASQLQALMNKSSKVRAFIPYVGQMKMSETLPPMSVLSADTREAVYVSTFTKADSVRLLEVLKQKDAGLTVIDQSARGISVMIRLGAVAGLANEFGVEFVEKILTVEPLHAVLDENEHAEQQANGDYTDLTGTETGTKVMGFDSIWSQGFHGEGQIVAMADTGLDSGVAGTIHPDFAGSIRGSGYYYGVGAKTWEDPMGHGTHVAGSIVGRGTVSSGLLKGGAYEASIVPQGLWSPIINGLTVPPKLSKLFEAAYADGARIHTNSWGSAQNPGAYDSMAQQVDEFMWNQPEFLVLYAAGNSGADMNKDGVIDNGSLGTPATSKNTLTVGASENLNSTGGIQKQVKELSSAAANWSVEPIYSSKLSDNPNGIACFSSRGPTKDGRLKPEIVAPGTNILSAMSQVQGASPMWGLYNKHYTYAGGTSMATPLTAAAAAVTRQVLQGRFGVNRPSAALIKATLMHTAKDLFPGQYGQGTSTQELKLRPNVDEGYGRVDMNAVAKLGGATGLADHTGVATGETFNIKMKVKQGQKLLVNMVYTDAPGTPGAAKALVNDIDLIVTGPTNERLTAATADSINNAEIFEQSNLAAGTYTITVKGTNVPMGKNGKQPFALVFTAN